MDQTKTGRFEYLIHCPMHLRNDFMNCLKRRLRIEQTKNKIDWDCYMVDLTVFYPYASDMLFHVFGNTTYDISVNRIGRPLMNSLHFTNTHLKPLQWERGFTPDGVDETNVLINFIRDGRLYFLGMNYDGDVPREQNMPLPAFTEFLKRMTVNMETNLNDLSE